MGVGRSTKRCHTNDRGQVHFHWDPSRLEYPNLLLFMIFDDAVAKSTERSRFRLAVPAPGDHPDYVTAPSLESLATAIVS